MKAGRWILLFSATLLFALIATARKKYKPAPDTEGKWNYTCT